MLNRSLFAVAALAAVGLVACGGGNSSPTTPTPGPTCNPGVTSQLIYPAPGATKVPATTSELVIAVSSPLPANTYNLALFNTANASNGSYTANALTVITASQLPLGSGTTTISNPTYEAVGLVSSLYATFNPGTNVQTAINDPSSNCTPVNVPGTFTLQ